jgi:acyl-coenzyme A synthetase/AMP-(fatty) acid ligase
MQRHKQMPCVPFSDRFNPVLDILARWASREPTATALVSIGSQGQLVQVQTAVDIAMLGVLRIGATAIPTPSQCTGRDVAYRVKVAQPVAIIADESASSRIFEVTDKDLSVRHRVLWSEDRTARSAWLDIDTLLETAGDGATPQDPTAGGERLYCI